MKYYKVMKESYDHFTGHTAIENELVTEKERNTKFRYLTDDIFKPVEISKRKVFWNFGCRFEMKGE